MTLLASSFGRTAGGIAAGIAVLLFGGYIVYHGLTLTREKLKADRHGGEFNLVGFLITFLPMPIARVILVLMGLFIMFSVVALWAGAK
jgi:hypothetical protein